MSWSEGHLARVRSLVPTGRTLDARDHAVRHRSVTAVLLVAGAATGVVAALAARPVHALLSLAVTVAALAVLRGRPSRGRSVLVATGLVTVAAVITDVAAVTEAHFLFFVVIPLIAFYEDWLPFATTTGLVAVHHLVGGALLPGVVFHHGPAVDAPVVWALIHVGALALMVLATLAHWRQHEQVRRRSERLAARLRDESRRDPLTALANRRVLTERMSEELARAERAGGLVAVLAIDLDGFKPLNDTYGHAIGDEVLVSVARRLEAACRATDLVARTGGDEFTVVAAVADVTEARRAAQRLLEVVAAPYADAPDAGLSASIGIALADGAAPVDDVLERADEAMYEAKHRGRGVAVVAEEGQATAVTGLHVIPADARAWARYVTAVRSEIATRKGQDAFPVAARAPESVHRSLQGLLAAIDQLPPVPAARLPLPDRRSLEELWFHHSGVQAWVDDLVEEGRLTVTRSAAAQRFWDALGRAVAQGDRGQEPVPIR